MTTEQTALAKTITETVVNHFRRAHNEICHHESGHLVVGWILGLDVEEATAKFGMDGQVRFKASTGASPLASIRAYLAACLAGGMAGEMAIAKGGPSCVRMSPEDIGGARGAAEIISNITGESTDTILTAGAKQAADILAHNWPAVLGCAERLKSGAKLWNLKTYLTVMVPIEKEN